MSRSEIPRSVPNSARSRLFTPMISRAVAHGALEIRLVVDLEERVEPGGPGRRAQDPDLLVGQGSGR